MKATIQPDCSPLYRIAQNGSSSRTLEPQWLTGKIIPR